MHRNDFESYYKKINENNDKAFLVFFSCQIVVVENFFSILLLLHPRLPKSPYQLLRNPSLKQPNLHELQRTLLLPYLLQHTNGQKHVWRTSNQTCDPNGPKLQQWQLYLTTYKRHGVPWPSHLRVQRWGVGS